MMRGLMSVIVVTLALSLAPLSALGASPVDEVAVDLEQVTAEMAATGAEWLPVGHKTAPLDGAIDADTDAIAAELQGERNPQFVFGNDDREQVTPAEPHIAWTWSVYDDGDGVLGAGDTIFTCTATFVGETVLITAAHCLYASADGGFPDWVFVMPGVDGDLEPYGRYLAEWLWVPNGWTDTEDFIYDFAFLSLSAADNVGNDTGWMEVGVLTDASLGADDLWATTIGYPGDKDEGTQWRTSAATLDEIEADLFSSQLDQVQGQSGSAIFRQADEAIFGVVSFEASINGSDYNVSRRVTQNVIDFGLDACQQAGCTIDYFIEGQTGPDPSPPPDPEPEPPAEPGDRPTEPAAPIPGCMYFDATQHNLCEPFLSYWQSNGGLPVFGFPTTEHFDELNQDLGQVFQTQYFERERLEYHPENAGTPYEILLGRLGHEVLLLQGRDWATFPKADPSADHYYAETGHAIAPEFWEYWSNHGLEFGDPDVTDRESLALFGLPLSPAQMETNSSGDTVLTQWFERARFEFHPDSDPGLQVKLGLLGNEFLAAGAAPPSPEPPAPEPPEPEPPTDGVPAEGDIIAESNLTDWTPVESPLGDYGEPTADGYAITNAPDSWLQVLADADFGDASYSIRTRVLQTAPVGLSCLIVRATPNAEIPILNDGAYQLCMAFEPLEEGGTPYIIHLEAIYEGPEASFVTLGVWEPVEPVSAADWHELKIIAQGSTLWLLIDGSLLGSVQHTGPVSGMVGFAAWNIATFEGMSTSQAQIAEALVDSPSSNRLQLGPSASTSRVEFTDLTVRQLQ